jgi:hypothetical protein
VVPLDQLTRRQQVMVAVVEVQAPQVLLQQPVCQVTVALEAPTP